MTSVMSRSRYFERLALGLALLLNLGYSLYYFHQTQTPFFALSVDDMQRTLYSLEASRGNLIPAPFWPPLHFWIGGLALRLYPNLLRMPMVVNLLFSLLGVVALYYLAKDLFGSQLVGLAAILMATFLPWHLWLSLSGLVEPIFHFFVILGFFACLRWVKAGSKGYLLAAALSFLLSGMLRYEGWLFSVPFTILSLIQWGLAFKSVRRSDHFTLLCALIPWLFPLAWCSSLCLQYGNPFMFSWVTRDYYLRAHGLDSLAARLLRHPYDLIEVSPSIFALAWYGVLKVWREQRRIAALLSFLWLSEFAMIIVSSVNGSTTMNNPIRMVVINAILLTPFAAITLVSLWRRPLWGKVLAACLLSAICLMGVKGNNPRPQGLPDDVAQAGMYVNNLWREGILDSNDRIMVEVLYWDYVSLRFMTGHPDNVLFDRRLEADIVNGQIVMDDLANPSILAADTGTLRRYLAKHNVKVVIAHSEIAIGQMAKVVPKAFANGRFVVFLVP